MIHDHEMADQDLEELAEEVWSGGERGLQTVEALRRESRLESFDASLERFVGMGLAREVEGRLELTASGREIAERQVRRHRLAEMLLFTVLDVRDENAVERSACVMEHVISQAVTDSVCAFLGHPKFCPHGKPIPSGPCCRSFVAAVEPLVQPLSRVPVGTGGRVVYIVPRAPERLTRLSSLGIVPGATVTVVQKLPAAVLRVGETTIAVDTEIAGEIYVKKTAQNGPRG